MSVLIAWSPVLGELFKRAISEGAIANA